MKPFQPRSCWYLLCVILAQVLLTGSTSAFFSKASTRQRPSPSPAYRTGFRNETVRIRSRVTQRKLIASPTKDDGPAPKRKDENLTLKERVRTLFRFIGKVLYKIKASLAVIAIQMVLSLRLERQVLPRLPPNILMFLLEVSMNDSKVIQSVAQELGQRISGEISAFTGKENYQVGDITKAIVGRYTGKEKYKFGDLTRATIARFTGKHKEEDVIEEQVKVTFMTRFMENFKGNKKEITENEVETILFKITGKKDYEFGDVTKAVLRRMHSND